MPMRYIRIPADVAILDPETKKPAKDEKGAEVTITFAVVLQRLLANAKWVESYAAIQSADAIVTALDDATDGVMQIAEEDWARLKEVVDQGGGKGMGWHPALVRQILPLLRAVVEASDKAPARAAEPLKAVE